jgi:hypothetical protein
MKLHDNFPESEIEAVTCNRRPENLFKTGACPPITAPIVRQEVRQP